MAPLLRSATAVLLAAAGAVGSSPPALPVNFTADVYMDGIIGGAAHITTLGAVTVSCDAAAPLLQRYHIDVRTSTVAAFASQTLRCDLGRIYQTDADGACCVEAFAPAENVLCTACQWDVGAFVGRKGACDWRGPETRRGDGGAVERYTIDGPCDDYLWSDTNVSIVYDKAPDGAGGAPAAFSRSTFVADSFVASAACAEGGFACGAASECCAAADGATGAACFAVDDCAQLSPSPLAEVDTFARFVAGDAPDGFFDAPAGCDTPCNGAVLFQPQRLQRRRSD